MKKIKLITSLSTLGVFGGAVAATASGCTWSGTGSNSSGTKVKMTKAYWTTIASELTGNLAQAFPASNEASFILVPQYSEFDNEDILTEINEKGIYSVSTGETAQALDANVYTSELTDITYISITPNQAGEYELKLNITLNNEPAEFGKGGEGKKYTVDSTINVKEGIPDLLMPTNDVYEYCNYAEWFTLTNGKYTGVQGTVSVNVADAQSAGSDPAFVNFEYEPSIIPNDIASQIKSEPIFKIYTVDDIENWKVTEVKTVLFHDRWDELSSNATQYGILIEQAFFSQITNEEGKLMYITLSDGTSSEVLADAMFGIYDANYINDFNYNTITPTSSNVQFDGNSLITFTKDGKNGTFTVKPYATISVDQSKPMTWTSYFIDRSKDELVPIKGITASYAPPKASANEADHGTLTVTLDKDLVISLFDDNGPGPILGTQIVIFGSGMSKGFIFPLSFLLAIE